MKVILGEDPTLTIGYRCFGCYANLTIGVGNPATHTDATNLAQDFGWLRREFHPGVNPWFCSKECSLDSAAAQHCEEYWKSHSNESKV